MKWYRVKKYQPNIGVELIIRIERTVNLSGIILGCYERYLIAELECGYEDNTDVSNWYLSNGCKLNIDLSEYKVTHFAMPDPIEIEND